MIFRYNMLYIKYFKPRLIFDKPGESSKLLSVAFSFAVRLTLSKYDCQKIPSPKKFTKP